MPLRSDRELSRAGDLASKRPMSTVTETSDGQLMDLLRRGGPMTVSQLADATGVTATAVRQRLNRLMGQDMLTRHSERSGRGRPTHRYGLSDRARRMAGTNFADLAKVLWQEIRAVEDPSVRKGLLQRIAIGLAASYQGQVEGDTTAERMASISKLFAIRDIPFSVEQDGKGLPVLQAHDCPYPELAEGDRGVCELEQMVMSILLEQDIELSQCRLDGATCCQFEAN